MKIVEGVMGNWHYHLSKTGENGKPALCGEKRVMLTHLPLSSWGTPGGHIPASYCKECDRLKWTGGND